MFYGGWRRSSDADGGFSIRGAGESFRVKDEIKLALGFDVLMSTDHAHKQDLLSKYFRVTRWKISAHRVGNESADFNKAADPKASYTDQLPGDMIGLDKQDLSDAEFAKRFRAFNKKLKFASGVWEVRCELAMQGKCDENESLGPEKIVHQAIRFQVYDGPRLVSSAGPVQWQPIKPAN